MEEEGLSCNGGGNIAEGGHLSLGHGRELAGDLHVFFELRDVVAAKDDGADGERKDIAHGVANVQRSRASGYTFPGALLLLDAWRSPAGEDTAARGDLHADDAHLLFDSEGEEAVGEAMGVVGVGCVEGKDGRVEGMAVDEVDDGFGVVVGGDTEKADDLLVLHLGEGFHGAAFREDSVDLLGDTNVVEQPKVEVVGLHELEGLFDIMEGAVAAALPALGGKEGVVAAVLHDASYVLLAPALGESVSGGGVDEVDAGVEGSLDEGDGDVEVVGLFDSALAAEGEDADFIACLSEVACGHGGLCFRIGGQGRKLVRRGLGFVGEEACSEGASGLQELTAVGEGEGLLHRRPLISTEKLECSCRSHPVCDLGFPPSSICSDLLQLSRLTGQTSGVKEIRRGLPTTESAVRLKVVECEAGYSRRKAVIGWMLKARRAGT